MKLAFKIASISRYRAFAAIGLRCAAITMLLIIQLIVPNSVRATPVTESAWDESLSSSMRLIAGDRSPDGSYYRAGIEIRLAPKYKTYWRVPGDSGVPPVFDFSGSTNMAEIEVLFPRPEVFEDASGKAIGYKDHLLLPLRVKPKQTDQPTILKVKLNYGVCDKLCIPAEGNAQLELLDRGSAENEAALKHSEAQVPIRKTIGEAGPIQVANVSKVIIDRDRPVFQVETRSQAAVILLAEALPSDWFLEVSEATERFADIQLFDVRVYDPDSEKTRVPCKIRLTIQGEKDAIEVPIRLDGCVEAP